MVELQDVSFSYTKEVGTLTHVDLTIRPVSYTHLITGADQIVVVKDGSIEAQGRHEDLLRHCPLYADLWQAHMGAKEGETV